MPAPALLAAIPAIVAAIGGIANTVMQNRSARKEYNRQQAYNTPAAQMQRFRDAGLSPYLAYGQANSGNMVSPAPAKETGLDRASERAGEGIDSYFTKRQQDQDFRTGSINQDILRNSTSQQRFWDSMTSMDKSRLAATQADRAQVELLSDFPRLIDDPTDFRGGANAGYRMRMNELKRSLSEAKIRQVKSMIENMGHRNAVDSVRAKYARDFGMVGGDWTQGLGLIKSIPSFFKKAATRGSGKLSGIPSKPRN